MVKRLFFAFLFIGALSPLFSQKTLQFFMGAGMNYNLWENSGGVNPNVNGAAFELGLRGETRYPFSIAGSLEVGAGGVTNYLSLNAGIEQSFSLGKGNFEITPGIYLIQGSGLTKPEVLYMWGLENKNVIGYRLEKGSVLGLVFGLRYYAYPGYSEYSSVYRFLDLNVGIAFRF